MFWLRILMFLVLLTLTAGKCAAEAANLSGTWRLNVNKSSWSGVRRPEMVVLRIDHREPVLKFAGSVDHPNEETRQFAFDGLIDGKEYPGQRSYGAGAAAFKRINDHTILSTFRSEDGQYVESTEIVVAADGRTLRQHIKLTTPAGKREWTEIYERRSTP